VRGKKSKTVVTGGCETCTSKSRGLRGSEAYDLRACACARASDIDALSPSACLPVPPSLPSSRPCPCRSSQRKRPEGERREGGREGGRGQHARTETSSIDTRVEDLVLAACTAACYCLSEDNDVILQALHHSSTHVIRGGRVRHREERKWTGTHTQTTASSSLITRNQCSLPRHPTRDTRHPASDTTHCTPHT